MWAGMLLLVAFLVVLNAAQQATAFVPLRIDRPTSTLTSPSNTTGKTKFGGYSGHSPNNRNVQGVVEVVSQCELLVVGAILESVCDILGPDIAGSCNNTGAAHVFVRCANNQSWVHEATLVASDAKTGDEFGFAVAVDGGETGFASGPRGPRIVVSALKEDSCTNASDPTSGGCPRSGAVYIFVIENRSDNLVGNRTWIEEARLKQHITTNSTNERFGWAVALQRRTLAVGIFYENNCARGVDPVARNFSCRQSGAVMVYRFRARWELETYLKQSNTVPTNTENFGGSLALDNDTLAVGADDESSCLPGEPENKTCPNSGAVYVFTRGRDLLGNNIVWSQRALLKQSQGSNRFFGSSIALAGNTLAIGCPFERSCAIGLDGDQYNSSCLRSGAVFVYSGAGEVWKLDAYIKGYRTHENDEFGQVVALRADGNVLAIGASDDACPNSTIKDLSSDRSCTNAGAVTVLERNTTSVFSDRSNSWNYVSYGKANPSQTKLVNRVGCDVTILSSAVVSGADEHVLILEPQVDPYIPPPATITQSAAGTTAAIQSSGITTVQSSDGATSLAQSVNGTTAVVVGKESDTSSGLEFFGFALWIIIAVTAGACLLLVTLIVGSIFVFRRHAANSRESVHGSWLDSIPMADSSRPPIIEQSAPAPASLIGGNTLVRSNFDHAEEISDDDDEHVYDGYGSLIEFVESEPETPGAIVYQDLSEFQEY